MFESNIFIKGGAFSEQTTLNDILTDRMNIVYGRNGSGKSTIARAFREQQPDRQTLSPGRNFELSFDGTGNLPADVCEHLFVFNEDFIDENVKVDDGLKSIVRIGSSAELDAPIHAAEEQIQKYNVQKKQLQDELNTLDGNAVGSIRKVDKDLKDSLKKAGGFLSRLDKMEGKAHNLVVSLLNPILSYNKDDTLPVSIGETAAQLNEDISKYLASQSGAIINWPQPDLSNLPDLQLINEILTKVVKPTDLTKEEESILDELSQELADEDFISKTRRLIIDSPREFCPLCHQPISLDHKQSLRQRLLKFRDKTIEEFQDKISAIKDGLPEIDTTLPSFPDSNYNKELSGAEAAMSKLNTFFTNIKVALDNKISNPSASIEIFKQDELDDLKADCQKALAALDSKVVEYNDSLNEKDKLRAKIDAVNIRLAYHENKSLIDNFNKLSSRREEVINQIKSINSEIQKQEDIITSLRAKIDQVDDAKDQINRYLDIIFGTNKLRLIPAGKDKYTLQIKKDTSFEDIPPRAISSGERNALALAYFFACVLEKKDKNYNYSDPTLLVIDDPVSSFDSENKAGVISLVADQCRKVLNGNPESKVLVLTHDYTTLRDLCNLRQDSDGFYCSLSSRHKLKRIDSKYINENMDYGGLLYDIYTFASFSDPDNYDNVDGIGNAIRKFAENYANHMYKCSWFKLFSDDAHLQCLPPKCRDSIRPFAVRNVLNSESHTVVEDYSPAEIQRSARILLTYMLYADERHLMAYLGGNKSNRESRIDTIREWFE